MDIDDLPEHLRQQASAELQPGERVAWVARPDPRRFTRYIWRMVLIGIPLTAFAVFTTLVLARFIPGVEVEFPTWLALPFALLIFVGLMMVSSPLWARRSWASSAYLITDRRAVVLDGERSRVWSFGPDRLGGVRVVEQPDGSGDVILDERRIGEVSKVTLFPVGARPVPVSSPIGFWGVPDVRRVERLLKELAAKSSAPAG